MKEHLGLPEFCYAPTRRTRGGIVRIIRGENVAFGMPGQNTIAEMNGALNVSTRQAAAMEGGLYYGWNSCHADPEKYTFAGDYIGPNEKELL